MNSGPRIAFFGGSFDPPHLGHLAVARAAREALALDTVLFAPVGAQPLKPQGSTASYTDRAAMTELAIANESGFALSRADAPDPAGKPNYTLDTLRRLRAEMPAYAQLFCLMGADSFVNLRHWHGAADIPFAASLIVASRPGQNLGDIAALLPEGLSLSPDDTGFSSHSPSIQSLRYCLRNTAGQTASFYLLPDLDVPISATELRQQEVSDPSAIPPPVLDYIRLHHLYAATNLAPGSGNRLR